MLSIIMKSFALIIILLSSVKSLSSDIGAKDKISPHICSKTSFHKVAKIQTVTKLKNNSSTYKVYWTYDESQSIRDLTSPQLGEPFEVIRCLKSDFFVKVGEGVVNENVNNNFQGLVKSGLDSKNASFPYNNYNMPMSGDIIVPIAIDLSQSLEITPIFKFASSKLFLQRQDGKGYSYQLSQNGENRIREAVKKLGKFSDSSRLIIEGFSLTPGNFNFLQNETRMRAQSISAFIKLEFPNIEDSKIAAFGLGNIWLNNSNEKHITRDLPLVKEGLILRLVSN